MSSSSPRDDGRFARELRETLEERCVDRALFGDQLSLDEKRDATALAFDTDACIEEFERIAAELDLCDLAREASRERGRTQIPHTLSARLEDMATSFAPTSSAQRMQFDRPRTQRQRKLDWFSAAACVAFGAGATLAVLRLTPPFQQTVRAPQSIGSVDPVDFLKSHPEAVHWPWAGTDDSHVAARVDGEAYFDAASGDGLLVIEGLAPNDPTQEQYQLWIFDKSRDARYPVDGGVFDVDAARVALPIAARLPVSEPMMFAVTVERPGGAVVSDRRIALLAKP